jgi:hypothetical protein
MRVASHTDGPYRVIGHDVPRIDGWAKVTGAVQYAADIVVPGMLRARSFGRIRMPASSPSTATGDPPGVECVFSRDDLHGMDPLRLRRAGSTFVAVDHVRYVGDVVAAVASADSTWRGGPRPDRRQYEPLPAISADRRQRVRGDPRRAPFPTTSGPRSLSVRSDPTSHVVSRQPESVSTAASTIDDLFDGVHDPGGQHAHLSMRRRLPGMRREGFSSTACRTRGGPRQFRRLLACRARGFACRSVGRVWCQTHPRLEPLVAAMARRQAASALVLAGRNSAPP